MQASMPAHQKFLSLVEERNETRKAIAEMDQNISDFDILSKSQKNPVQIPSSVAEPTAPVRPSRVLNIGMGLIASFGLGIGLVCLLEHVDHSVKVPEHVTHGLTLPLLGVVPRIRRTALTHRGGHLWTPGHARLDRGRRLPEHLGQPAGDRRSPGSDRDPTGNQRQGGRGQEHDRAQPGRHLRPGG